MQLQAVRAALAAADPREGRETLRRIGRDYGVRIIPDGERRMMRGNAPPGPLMRELAQRLREASGRAPRSGSAPGRGCR
ncbi:MAG: hypothetical protein IPJ62_11830 [Betaproteobacteria bacterium]|nr:hypothetical protein [Betaproteobacteria bacterium]